MKTLIVVDMLNDFIDEKGALFIGPTGRAIVPLIAAKIAEYRANGDKIVFVCDSHDEDDLEFARFPKHSVTGTWGAEIIPELAFDEKRYLEDDTEFVVTKQRYSAFYGTDIEDFLFEYDNVSRDIIKDTVEVVGDCTSICVMNTVADLANRDFDITVLKDAVADFDPEAHAFALKYMQNILGAKVI